VVFLCAAIFINSVGMGVIAPVLPLFANQEFQINHTQVGLVVGLHGMGRIFVSLPAGYFTQRYGRRFMLLWGTTVNLAGAAMVSISFNYTWLVLWRMVSGMGSKHVHHGCIGLPPGRCHSGEPGTLSEPP
jgi:MFS family permease